MELRKLNDDVVELCKRAAQTGNFDGISKAAIEQTLDAMAVGKAERDNVTVEQAYDRIMQSSQGQLLYSTLERVKLGNTAA